jgi:hypothetical protein
MKKRSFGPTRHASHRARILGIAISPLAGAAVNPGFFVDAKSL